MAFEIEGTICEIYATVQVTASFKTRRFVLDISHEYQDVVYEEYAVMQCVNGHCELLDDFVVGDRVRVLFNLKGTRGKGEYSNTFYNNLTAYRIHGVPQEYVPVTHEQKMENFRAQQPFTGGDRLAAEDRGAVGV